MKKIKFLIAILIIADLTSSQAQDTWTQQTDFGGGNRNGVIGFSIGNKGYIGTGGKNGVYYKDFWEYDPIANTWTQKANFGGNPRAFATGFNIGDKGYIGTGYSSLAYYQDFWQYDPNFNTWTQKANFGGSARDYATGFGIADRGYLGTGTAYGVFYKDFWEYNPATDTWTKKSDFGGGPRSEAISFGIDGKGYIGTGNNFGAFKNDFWEYDPESDTWIQKTNFEGSARAEATGFSIESKGYVGTGLSGGQSLKDFWEYDPEDNTWTQKADFGGTARFNAVGFSISSKGYIGTGWDGSEKKDFWEYTPDGIIAACNIPTSLSTVNITSTITKLQWNAAIGAIGYKVRYKITGTSKWSTIQSADNDKTLSGLTPNTEYVWQVKSICGVLPIVSSDWSEKQFFTTDPFRLSEATVHEAMEIYPNPVSQSATVSFYLNQASPAVIEIIDVNGRSLGVIADETFSEGDHEITFNRESLSAGIYFLQMKTNEEVMMKKIVIE